MTFPDQITVSVTADDIAGGWIGDGESCPIARAVLRTQSAALVHVLRDSLRFWHRDYAISAVYRLPDEAEAFIAAFDAYEAVEPFTFTARLDAGPGTGA